MTWHASLRLPALALAGVLAACAELPSAPGPAAGGPLFAAVTAATGFVDDFAASTLDAGWTVVTPPRVIAPLYLPPNHHSLTARPGFLRYQLDPWTHGDGFFNGYAPSIREHSCCNHNAGLELLRTITGEHWRLEARGEFWLPYRNGRWLDMRVYFGDGGPGTYAVIGRRGRDVNQNYLGAYLLRQTGTTVSSLAGLESPPNQLFGIFEPAGSTAYFRIERAGGVLSAAWSTDGIGWTHAWTHDAGSDLDGLTQTVVLAGLMWSFMPTSFVDWDYIKVQPTEIAIAIDIKPGSDPNSINPRQRGVIPVAILTTPDFDAAAVDPASVRFGATGVEAAPAHHAAEDVDGDGDVDLILHFPTQATGIACGATSAVLRGATWTGQPVRGSDAIVTAGCK